jgi:hypothetical protein
MSRISYPAVPHVIPEECPDDPHGSVRQSEKKEEIIIGNCLN